MPEVLLEALCLVEELAVLLPAIFRPPVKHGLLATAVSDRQVLDHVDRNMHLQSFAENLSGVLACEDLTFVNVDEASNFVAYTAGESTGK